MNKKLRHYFGNLSKAKIKAVIRITKDHERQVAKEPRILAKFPKETWEIPSLKS